MYASAARLARALVTAELPIVLLIAPALLFPTPARLAVLGIVPILWLAARVTTNEALPRTPINAAILLLLVTVVASLIATFDVRFSLGKVSGVILGSLLFWAVARWLRTPARLRMATAMFLVSGGLLAVAGVLGSEGSDKLSLLQPFTDRPRLIRGVPGAEEGFNPNAVSGCLVLFVPIQLSLLVTGALKSGTRRYVTGGQMALLALTTGSLVLMQSRGAWVGLLVAGVAFLCWHSGKTRIAAAVGILSATVLWTLFGSASVLDRAINRSGAGISDTVAGRIDIWMRATDGVRDFPFTGMGMNTFRRIMPLMYPSRSIPEGKDVAHAHNHLLQAALDLGVPGLIAYVAMWFVAAALLVAVYRRATDRFHRVMAGGVGAGLIAHFVFGLTDAIPLGAKVGVLFWLTLALCVGLHRVAVSNPAADA